MDIFNFFFSQGHPIVVEELLQRHASLKINQEKESPLAVALKVYFFIYNGMLVL